MEQKTVEKPSLFGIIWSPVEQFEKIRNRPRIWIPLLIVSALYVIGTYFSISQLDYTELLGDAVPAEQLDMAVMVGMITGMIASLFTPILSILISSAIFMLIAKIAASDVSFKQLFSMNTYISLIGALGLVLNGLIGMAIGKSFELSITSLAGVMGSQNAVLGAIELFTIWGTILTAIGLHKVAGLSKGLAWTVTIVFFLISLGFAYITTALSGMNGI
ncbi:MAG: Yip1 family protein [Bacillus sp. (in: firmicutes)]